MLPSFEEEGLFLALREGERGSDIGLKDFSTGISFGEKDSALKPVGLVG